MDSSASLRPFHLAFPVHDLVEARQFYNDVLGCTEGRSSEHWVDFSRYGQEVVAHLATNGCTPVQASDVDEHEVPGRHFGVVRDMPAWEARAPRLEGAGIRFTIEP